MGKGAGSLGLVGGVVVRIKNWFSIMIDWSVFKNRFFDPIIDFRSYMIYLFIYLWLTFAFFFDNEKRPISLSMVNKRSIINQWVNRSFIVDFSINSIFLMVSFRFKSILIGMIEITRVEPVPQTSKPGSNPSWNATAHPVYETFNVMYVIQLGMATIYLYVGNITILSSLYRYIYIDISVYIDIYPL